MTLPPDGTIGPLAGLLDDSKAKLELLKLRLDLAWKHFDFHARQRTTMFNFFIIILGLIITGFTAAIREEGVRNFGPFIALTGVVISTAFFFIDVRNTYLLEYSERIIAEIEGAYLFAGFTSSENSSAFRAIAKGQLGTLYRERLESDPGQWGIAPNNRLCRALLWLSNKHSTHKVWIRLVILFATFGFFVATLVATVATQSNQNPSQWILVLREVRFGELFRKAFDISVMPWIAGGFLLLAYGTWALTIIYRARLTRGLRQGLTHSL